eukprot:TRINITY_DN53504_c0_g1_i1.p1 TRINITY_DN53504_c0_g1~~TRINITY_DN53504_c0_g1_i1.p1  ORF type:complete len:118 (+),score=44.18 TRINITY_DN53504_c0_g1_i1:82-435(+)
MIRRPPRSTLSSSSAASDVYKRQANLRESQLREEAVRNESVELTARHQREMVGKDQEILKLSKAVGVLGASEAELRARVMVSEPELTPVSYTHLRAHETPEHLVCRLLLEKKKKECA